jgi:NADP-dependent 3-hydroxy acid dehydrogenase YdfG
MREAHYVATPAEGCAWITGASSGIGRGLALALAAGGWTVAVTARSADALEELGRESETLSGQILAFPGDVRNAAAMKACLEHINEVAGAVALCIANAGVYLPQDGLSGNAEEWQRTIDVNLTGTVNVILPVIDQMKTRGRGQIAIVSSVAGYRGLPTSAAYGATKAALINMAESLKFDLDRAGIRIQLINPGFVDTPATKSNPFPMPYLMTVEQAVSEIRSGLTDTRRFEIAFPGPFVRRLKALRLLPYRFYFRLIAKTTGWADK